jgi:ASC-1-like (ASCH) protein
VSITPSAIFVIFILKADVHKVRVFPEFQFVLATKPFTLFNKNRQFLAHHRQFYSQICKYLHYSESQKYKFGVQQ